MELSAFFSRSKDSLCSDHQETLVDVNINLSKRFSNLSKRYVLEKRDSEGTSYVAVQSNVKGSVAYSYRMAYRLSRMKPPSNNIPFLCTFTWPVRDDCLCCSYRGIMSRWRNFRQNWKNYDYPSIGAYVGVLEPHRDLYPHLHFVFYLSRYFSRAEISGLHKVWGARVDVTKATSPVGYIFKYVTKGLKDLTFISLLSVLKTRQFFASRGLIPKYFREKSEKYFFLGSTTKDLNEFSAFCLWSRLEGHIRPDDDVNPEWIEISSIKDLVLFGKY